MKIISTGPVPDVARAEHDNNTPTRELPIEVGDKIFSYLPHADLLQVNAVCEHWRERANDDLIVAIKLISIFQYIGSGIVYLDVCDLFTLSRLQGLLPKLKEIVLSGTEIPRGMYIRKGAYMKRAQSCFPINMNGENEISLHYV
uniref:F-box domain-containing protein n=1 Tax=Glossina palpalis gambiensis TaxID=67801 RepID=A0A1B0BQL5_9MUSC